MNGPAAEVALLVGRTLGHYRILDKIGEGGIGEVYRARDEHLGRDVAIKVLRPGMLSDGTARIRFREEAHILSQLSHPNIATIYDFDTQAGADFLVMECVPGVTLNERLTAGPLPEKEVARLGGQLSEGLAAAHEQGIIHRDLKPSNLRLTPNGRLKILDFGLAKLVQPATGNAETQSLSQTRALVGTFPYMAPEQLRGEKVDAGSDIWAAGVVLYEMVTARLPFTGKTSTAVADQILHAQAPPPQRWQPRCSQRLADIILKCLEKDAENRYQSAKELQVDLRRLTSPMSTGGVVVRKRTRSNRIRSLAVLPSPISPVTSSRSTLRTE